MSSTHVELSIMNRSSLKAFGSTCEQNTTSGGQSFFK